MYSGIPQDFVNYVKSLERRINELSRLKLTSAVIPDGKFSVLHPNGAWLFHVGQGTLDKRFVTIRRDDGTAALEIGTGANGEQYWGLWDRSGNLVASDDATSGAGLGRPWLSQPTINILNTAIPMTINATWISTQSSGQVIKQQPKAELEALVRSEGGATGQARFTVNGVQVGSLMDIAANAFEWKPVQTVNLPGTYDSRVRVEVQVQRTNTVGTVGAVFRWSQRQT